MPRFFYLQLKHILFRCRKKSQKGTSHYIKDFQLFELNTLQVCVFYFQFVLSRQQLANS